MEMMQSLLGTIMGYLQLVEITDVIDVLAVAYLIYKGMALLRRSSAAQVVKAIVLIVALLWLSYQLNLSVVSFILSKAMELGLLALVVVFQPEIRRFLEELGSNDLGQLLLGKELPQDEIETAIQETVLAYTELSRDRVGALIVFERKNSLQAVTESGTRMDATVSVELMKNIFYPKAPLHDGAVVIRKGRVSGAACMLPLSANRNLSRDLGTRHRAGIGISEQSDAVVAIVSEETGTISVAIGGRLRRHLAPETLERILRNELLPKENAPPKSARTLLTRWFRRGGGVK
jgi:diadenylate cyclase